MSDGRVVVETDLDNSGIEQGLSKLGGLVKAGIAAAGIGKIATELFEVGKAAVGVGAGFEDGMSKVSAISGATGDELAQLAEKAKQMGADTKFSATEASQAFQYMAMAGWKTGDMLNGIGGIMDLAAASGEDLASVSDIVTDAITAFGLSASDSGHFADVLASASSNANTNVSMLGESFKYVAPVAGAMNYSVEDVSTALGLMANASVKGSMAGTSLKTALANMASPTDAMAEVMDKYGISLTNADGSMKTLGEVIGNLRSSLGGLDEATQTATASTLFGKEAMAGMLAIVNASPADYQKLTDAIYNADGTAKNMADTMQDNFKGSVEQLGGSLETLGIQFYEYIQDPLKDVANSAHESVDRISSAFTSDGFSGAVEEAGNIFGEFIGKIESSDKSAGIIIGNLEDIGRAAVSLGKEALPVATKAAGLLWKNLDKLISIAGAGAAAFATLKIVNKVSKWYTVASAASKAYAAAMTIEGTAASASSVAHLLLASTMSKTELVVGVLTGRVSLATAGEVAMTAATGALSGAMSFLAANPFALVLAGTAALVSGFLIYENVTGSASEKVSLFTEEETKLHEQIAETTKAVQESKEAREEALNGVMEESTYNQSLADELRTIVDENGNVKAGYEARAGFITSTLADALGLEIELVDGQIKGYGELSDAIDKAIEKKKAEAVLSAYEESYKEAIKGKTEALKSYLNAQEGAAEASTELANAQTELGIINNKAKSEIEEYGKVCDDTALAQDEASAAVDRAKEKYEGQSKALNDARSDYEYYNNTIKTYEGLSAAILENDSAKIQEALTAIQTDFKYYGQATDTELKQQAINASQNMALLGEAIKNGTISATDSAVTEFANMSAMSLAELSKLSGGAAEVAKDINPAMLGQLVALSGSLNAESKAAVQSFIEGLNGVDDGTREKFENAVKAAVEGSEFGNEVSNKADELGCSYLDALREVLQVHSPSRAVKEIFSQVIPGAMEGADAGKEGLVEKGVSLITDFLNGMNSGDSEGKAQGIGEKIMSFFGIGVSSQVENSKTAGKTNADAANAGAGSVNPESTGGFFANLFSGGIFRGKGNSQIAGKENADAAKQGAESINPSGTGSAFGGQYASGVSSKSGASYKSGTGLADNADSGAGSKSGYTPGSDFGSGFVRGIGDWVVSAAKKAAELASAAYNSAKSWLDEHSPSKKTKKLGNWFSQGLGVGIEEEADSAVKAAENMSQQVLDAINPKAVFEGVDISKQIALMRSAMNAEKLTIGNTMVMKVVHEIVFDSLDTQGEAGDSTEPKMVNQNINIYQPVKSPVETARELKRAGKELAWRRK